MAAYRSPGISPTEWRVLLCVWDLGSATPMEVAGHLEKLFGRSSAFSPKTVGILLARVAEKGLLRAERTPAAAMKGRPPNQYTAAISKTEGLRLILEQFVAAYHLDEGDLVRALEELSLVSEFR